MTERELLAIMAAVLKAGDNANFPTVSSSAKNVVDEAKAILREIDREPEIKHRHVSNGVNDECAKCGHDLRNEIHERIEQFQ